MKVFADLHHQDLYHSLQILFERRLGWTLYRPIGLEWFQEGFWHVYPHINTARQFLDITVETCLDIFGNPIEVLHGVDSYVNKDINKVDTGIYKIIDTTHIDKLDHNAITLEAFKNIKFDIVIASMPSHIEPFKKLIKQYQPHAKFIFQAGNNWPNLPISNLLTSAKLTTSSLKDHNRCFYHQEFDLNIFKPRYCNNPKSIMNLQHFTSSVNQLIALEKELNDWDVHIYGAGNRDNPYSAIDLHKAFATHGFLWHVKKEDEGYGYNIHQAFATGTPALVGCSYQNGMTSADLYENYKTVIDVNKLNTYQIAEELRKMADNYNMYSNYTYNKFKQHIDFDAEFIQITHFLENLR